MGEETARYEPSSDFLRSVFADEVTFAETEFGEQNLQRLIAFTTDADPKNRDWAILFLSQLELDRPDVREALLRAADDENPFVRAEAILGLVMQDRLLALKLVKRELEQDQVQLQILEAARVLADPSLVEYLACFQDPSGEAYLDELAQKAFQACLGNDEQ